MAEEMSTDLPESQENGEESAAKEGNVGPGTGQQFTSEYQPDPEAKREGQRRYWTLRKMLNLSVPIKDKKGNDLRDIVATVMGVPVEEVTLQTIMEFKQIEKAMNKGDTNAFKAVKEYSVGKPRPIPEEPPPVPLATDSDVQKSEIDLGGGITFQVG